MRILRSILMLVLLGMFIETANADTEKDKFIKAIEKAFENPCGYSELYFWKAWPYDWHIGCPGCASYDAKRLLKLSKHQISILDNHSRDSKITLNQFNRIEGSCR